MTTDADKLKKYQAMLANGIIDDSDFKKLTAGLTVTATGDGNTTAVEHSVAVGGNVRRDLFTGDGVHVTNIINYYREGGPQPVNEPELRQQIAGYLRWLFDCYHRLELRGVKHQGQQIIRLELDEVYVPLAAQTYRSGGWKEITLDRVLTLDHRVVITGAPGCGKTTVLLYFAVILSRAMGQNNAALAANRLGVTANLPLPIYIPLNRFATYRRNLPPGSPAERDTMAAFISDYLIRRQTGLDLPPDFFRRLLKQGERVILLLDGLDEVPDERERAEVRQKVEDLLRAGPDKLRVVVTCRTAAYVNRTVLGGGFTEVKVLPLEPAHIAQLVEQAYTVPDLYGHNPELARAKAAELLAAIDNLEEQRRRLSGEDTPRLVTSPLLVRMLIMVHLNERRLPDQRAELYQKATENLLLPEYNPVEEVTNHLGGLVGEKWQIHLELAQYVAYHLHRRGQKQGRDIAAADLKQLLAQHPLYPQLGEALMALARSRSGVLEVIEGEYRFIHLAFQEFLTARYLVETVGVELGLGAVVALLEQGPLLESWWREPILLAAGYLSANKPGPAQTFLRRLAGVDDAAAGRNAPPDILLAGAELAGAAALEWPKIPAPLRAELTDRLTAFFTTPALMLNTRPVLRAAAGNVLARLGDERPGVGLLPAGLPDIDWCEVPAGPFLYGDKRQKIELPAFKISRYPVTNAQYRAFVADGGYTDQWQHCWTEAGWAWKGSKTQPEQYGGGFDLPNRPVVGVSWYEAVAFSNWLNERIANGDWANERMTADRKAVWLEIQALIVNGKSKITLPTEREWEKAARGTDGREYPWGNNADPNKANYDDTRIGTTSAVGCFPQGESIYGCRDMTGNVWEWCRTKYKQPDNHDLEGTDVRVLRGGAFYDFTQGARCAYRDDDYPDLWDYALGFRVVLSPFF